ncbi:MAG: class I SAM-dependent methyltransferase [Oleiphilaceae bacterium]|nr:class I SAM-dependent methyltransferase [Oleiphilaceae bacterium]
MHDKYRLIGPVYELLSCIYSGRNIHHCKNAMLCPRHIRPGDRILVAGVGHGHDAIAAARLGAQVTVVDLSATMLAQFRRTLARKAPGLDIHTHHGDILEVNHQGRYDMVIANFFLNVFDRPTMEHIFRHLVAMSRPGGRIVVGDFSYPSGNPLARAFKRGYWMLAALVFWLLANNALHPIYNYPRQMARMGLRVDEKRHFRLLGINCFWSILARKPGPGDSDPPPLTEVDAAEEAVEQGATENRHPGPTPAFRPGLSPAPGAAPCRGNEPSPTTAGKPNRGYSDTPVTHHSSLPD